MISPRRALALVVAHGALLLACNATLPFEQVDGGSDAPAETSTCLTTGCGVAALHCDQDSATCEECVVDGDCPLQLPRCDTAVHRCFQCLEEGDCRAGETCIVAAKQCVRTCSPTQPCSNPGAICDPGRSICVSCSPLAPCHDLHRPICDAETGRCVECLSDANCPPGHARCDVAMSRCVECLTSADCPAAYPVCDPDRWNCVAP